MKCSLCSKKALRHVGKKGFCGDHTTEAFHAEAENVRRQDRGRSQYEHEAADYARFARQKVAAV